MRVIIFNLFRVSFGFASSLLLAFNVRNRTSKKKIVIKNDGNTLIMLLVCYEEQMSLHVAYKYGVGDNL